MINTPFNRIQLSQNLPTTQTTNTTKHYYDCLLTIIVITVKSFSNTFNPNNRKGQPWLILKKQRQTLTQIDFTKKQNSYKLIWFILWF